MARNIVQAQGITKTFGKTRVLEGIDLNISQGSVLALFGPNGAGKTTTFRILSTLLQPDSGTIAGYDVLRQMGTVSRVAGADETINVPYDIGGTRLK